MTASSAERPTPDSLDVPQLLKGAREVIEAEAAAVLGLVDQLDGEFARAVHHISRCRGRVVVTGIGKSGLVGQKISATLASTGTPSLFLHAAEAVHGDLGRLARDDVVVALSNSGQSEEILRLLRPVKSMGVCLIVITADRRSALALHADVAIATGNIVEACPMGLVPTASTTAMMALGDALAMSLFVVRGLGREDYAQYHPGGSLGRKLMRVEELMRRDDANPVVSDTATLRQAMLVMTETPGRPGATSIVDAAGNLVGFFTDGDLRRLLMHARFSVEIPMREVMQKNPKYVAPDQRVADAARLMREHHVDQVPVVAPGGGVLGFLDIQDLLTTKVI